MRLRERIRLLLSDPDGYTYEVLRTGAVRIRPTLNTGTQTGNVVGGDMDESQHYSELKLKDCVEELAVDEGLESEVGKDQSGGYVLVQKASAG